MMGMAAVLVNALVLTTTITCSIQPVESIKFPSLRGFGESSIDQVVEDGEEVFDLLDDRDLEAVGRDNIFYRTGKRRSKGRSGSSSSGGGGGGGGGCFIGTSVYGFNYITRLLQTYFD